MSDRSFDPAPGAPCNRRACMCTHTAPCDRGWVDVPPVVRHGMTYETVAPCAVCRPQSFDRYARALEAQSTRVRA